MPRNWALGSRTTAMDVLEEMSASSADLKNISKTVAHLVESVKITNENLDVFFLSTMGLLVYFMQCGFAFLEAGSVRGKSTTNILIKNALDAFLGCIAYYAIGWALAYGEPGNPFCGTANWFLVDLPEKKLANWFFEYVFAATAATIVSGALAERCNFAAYLVYSVFITGFVYPVITHWVWSPDGWLAMGISMGNGTENGTITSPFHDFAGSGAVHATGGIASLVGAALLGPRLNRFHPETGQPQPMPGHSVPHVTLGAFILYFTFLAFNGGSQLTITNPGDGEAVAIVMVNTVLSCSCGGAVGLILAKLTSSHWSLLETINASLAGTVAICSGCNVVYPWGACIIGGVGALAYAGFARLVLRMKIDDPASSVAVHLGGGAWGVLSVAFFHRSRGILLVWNRQSGLDLAVQVIGLLAIVAWSGSLAFLVFAALKRLGLLRASQEFEIKGVDTMKHGEPAYPEVGFGNESVQDVRPGTEPVSSLTRRSQRRRFSSGMMYEYEEPAAYANPSMSAPLTHA